MARNQRRRRARRKNSGLLVLCVFIEILAVTALVLIVGWNRGVGDWLRNQSRPVVQELDLSGINSPYALLMQVKGGKVVGQINGEEQMYPASLTKMMTVLVAAEELRSSAEVTLTSDMFAGLYERDATQAGFQPDETVTVRDLLYGAILPSGAECCQALAVASAGSVEEFLNLMNKKAEKLGMEHTHFCDTTGLHEPDHYSTALDMAILLKECLKNDELREILSSSVHSTKGTNVHPDGITFYSSLFKSLSDPGVTGGQILGGKTGYTDAAGYCLASFAEVGGREYILVTGGTTVPNGHIQDAQTIYNRLGVAYQALESEG